MKKVTICICGSIAAHKMPALVEELAKYPIEIYIAMTQNSQEFVSPLVLEVLSGNPIFSKLMGSQKIARVDHVFLAQESDAIIIAPATANTTAKLAHGIADDVISTICSASPSRVPKIIAPAMNEEMYYQPIFQENLAKLKARGFKELPPQVDILASGKTGVGALASQETIIHEILITLDLN